jgi:hypothetical protein
MRTLKIVSVAVLFSALLAVMGCQNPLGFDGDAARSAGQPTVPSSWTSIAIPPLAQSVTINGIAASSAGTWVAIGGWDGAAYATSSTDTGTSWSATGNPLPSLGRSPSVINYVNDTFLVTAGNSATAGAYSTNGTSWSPTGTIGFGSKASAYSPDVKLYVIGGQYGQVVTTPDLVTISAIQSGTDTTFDTGSSSQTNPQKYINAAVYSNGSFILGGGKGHVAYSKTGTGWTPVTDTEDIFSSSMGAGDGFINWMAVGTILTGETIVVAVGGPDLGNGKAAFADSTALDDWSQASVFPLGIGCAVYSVAFGANSLGFTYFVAGDDNGNIAYSSNGNIWTQVPTASNPFAQAGVPINAIAYDAKNYEFIAVGGTANSVRAAISIP